MARSQLVLIALLVFSVGAVSAAHTCNSGWENWLEVADKGQSYNETAVNSVFDEVLKLVGRRQKCKVESSYKLEGCYDTYTKEDGTLKGRKYGLGAKVAFKCKNDKKKTLHVIVNVKASPSGKLKLTDYYTAKWWEA